MRKGKRFKAWEGHNLLLLALKNGDKGPLTMKCGWPLADKNGPHLTAREKMGTVVLQLQETEFCQQPK